MKCPELYYLCDSRFEGKKVPSVGGIWIFSGATLFSNLRGNSKVAQEIRSSKILGVKLLVKQIQGR